MREELTPVGCNGDGYMIVNRVSDSKSESNESLIKDHFYWVKYKYAGWQPALYSHYCHGIHFFSPIGMDYDFGLGSEILSIGDEIIVPEKYIG